MPSLDGSPAGPGNTEKRHPPLTAPHQRSTTIDENIPNHFLLNLALDKSFAQLLWRLGPFLQRKKKKKKNENPPHLLLPLTFTGIGALVDASGYSDVA